MCVCVYERDRHTDRQRDTDRDRRKRKRRRRRLRPKGGGKQGTAGGGQTLELPLASRLRHENQWRTLTLLELELPGAVTCWEPNSCPLKERSKCSELESIPFFLLSEWSRVA